MKWWPSPCKKGDMIRVRCGSVYHYGIYVSDGEVIAFGPRPDLGDNGADYRVASTDIYEFAGSGIVETAKPETFEERRRFSSAKTVSRARGRLGEGGYDIIRNNCEHFAYDCVYGVKRSTQTEELRRRFYSRPALNVYILPANGFVLPKTVYPPERMAEILRAEGELRLLRGAAWSALEKGMLHTFDRALETLKFHKSENGKWGCDGYFFSLSHTKDAVAVAVSNSPVGVDIEDADAFGEKYAEVSERFCEKALTKKELSQGTVNDGEAFLRLWTRKESIFKRRGNGAFLPNEIEGDASEAMTVCFALDGRRYVLSVCAEQREDASFYLLGGDRPCRLDTQKFD